MNLQKQIQCYGQTAENGANSHSLPYFIFVFAVPILKGATFLKIWPVQGGLPVST